MPCSVLTNASFPSAEHACPRLRLSLYDCECISLQPSVRSMLESISSLETVHQIGMKCYPRIPVTSSLELADYRSAKLRTLINRRPYTTILEWPDEAYNWGYQVDARTISLGHSRDPGSLREGSRGSNAVIAPTELISPLPVLEVYCRLSNLIWRHGKHPSMLRK
jgi:hypothetical protein